MADFASKRAQVEKLRAEREALDKQLADLNRSIREEAIERIRAEIDELGLWDVFHEVKPKAAKAAKTSGKRAPRAKYRDPVSGVIFNGFGRRPDWLPEDKEAREAFLYVE